MAANDFFEAFRFFLCEKSKAVSSFCFSPKRKRGDQPLKEACLPTNTSKHANFLTHARQYFSSFSVFTGEREENDRKGGITVEDSAIVGLYWARNQQAILESDQKYGELCRGLSTNILENFEDAEECVNDTWIRAWNTMPPQRPGSLRAYFCRIVRNLSIDRWRADRAKKRGEGLELLLGELEDCIPSPGDVEEETENRELLDLLEKWLQELSPEDRDAFLRRYWYGSRVDQLACRHKCTPGQMSQRLFRLRKRLRQLLEREGVRL